MRLLTTLFFTYTVLTSTAQDRYAYVDDKALQIPLQQTYSTAGIAQYINENFTLEGEKIRAAYTWIINHIEYSKDSMFHFNAWGIDPEKNMGGILRRRKGVCENYAALFTNILLKCGVQAAVVTGYTNLPGNNYWNGHGWVAVQLDKEWYLCDPTWDAGYASYLYYMVQPPDFIRSHIPFDPLWQLLDHPVSHKDFKRGYFSARKNSPVYHYKDSVTAYLQSDTLQQMKFTAARMKAAGIETSDQQTWYTYNQMKVQIVHEEENMQLYNDAVAGLNKAKKIYNELVLYRNNNFIPAKTPAETGNLFTAIDKLVQDAFIKLDGIVKKSENFQYDTDSLKENLNQLLLKAAQQQTYIKNHLSLSKNR